MKELICIVCPKGCHLRVDENDNYRVEGHGCARGEAYGREELTNPTRTITSTVRIHGAMYERCPVKTAAPIPKGLIADAMRLLDDVDLQAPVRVGEVVIEDLCGTGVAFIATRNM